MAGTASLLLAEAVLLGRAASGERLSTGLFRDSWRIRRVGRLVFAEEMRLAGDLPEAMAGKVTLAGAGAFATVCLVSPDAPGRLPPCPAPAPSLDWRGLQPGRTCQASR